MQGQVTSLVGDDRRYLIERELGHGGMGVVYQVLDLERNTRIALKAIHKIDAISIYRLKNEFRQLADLSHPNLVSLHDLCCEGERWFFTMELVVGETFDQYVAAAEDTRPNASKPSDRALQPTLARRARLLRDASVTLSQHGIVRDLPAERVACDLGRLREALRQLVSAVAAIHDAGKLHRDIKPSNVLVTTDGRVVVLDFGLVSSKTIVDSDESAADRTIGGAVFGTPAYMSPEQAAGEPVTTASDWYSVGCMLYEALTGQLPFDGSVLEIIKRKDEQEPSAPSEIVRGVPEDLNELCCALLRRRPEDRPSTAELQRLFGRQSTPPPPPRDPDGTFIPTGELFIGREPHLERLRRAFEGVQQGRAATVFVHGHSGMGKSALVRCFTNDLINAREALVLRGRCYERESVPYKAFDDIVDALSRYMMRLPNEEASELLPRNIHALAHLFPVLRRVRAVAQARVPLHVTSDPHEIRSQAFGALRDLLARLSDWQPLVITIDDLQWGDVDSARLLTHLLGPPDAPPILFVGVYRREELQSSAFLRSLVWSGPLDGGIGNLEELRVDPLTADESAYLVRELLGRDTPTDTEFARAISVESEGVPFFIGELAHHAKAQRSQVELAAISLDDVIMARVRELASPAQRLLEVLSVAARPLEQGVALEAAELPAGDREAIQALRAARLIRTRGTRQTDPAETYHDRVREAVTAELSAARVREIHARVARASEQWGVGEPEQLVVHYAEAGEGVRAGETAQKAALSAAGKLAFNRAADLYRKAIELLDPRDTARRRELYEQLGDALANSGRGSHAAGAYLAGAHSAAADQASGLRRKATQQLLRSGRVEEGTQLLEQLLDEAGLPGFRSNARVVSRLLLNKGRLRLATFSVPPANDRAATDSETLLLETLAATFREVTVTDMLRGSMLHSEFLRCALKAGDPDRMLEGLAWEAMHVAFGQGVAGQARVEWLLCKSDDLATQLGTPAAQATVMLARAACYVALARFRAAYPLAREAERLLREHCPGTFWERSLVLSCRYACVELIGSLRELSNEAYERAREASERDDGFARVYLGVHAHLAQLMQGDAAAALRALEEEGAQLGRGFTTYHLLVMTRTTDAINYTGDGRGAWRYFEPQWSAFTRTLMYRFRPEYYLANAAYLRGRTAIAAFLATKDRERLRDARAAEGVLQKLARPDAQMYAKLISAGLARCERSDSRAATALTAALAIARMHGYDMFSLYIAHCLARVERTPSAVAEARAAEAALRAQGVHDPIRWIAVYLPGFS